MYNNINKDTEYILTTQGLFIFARILSESQFSSLFFCVVSQAYSHTQNTRNHFNLFLLLYLLNWYITTTAANPHRQTNQVFPCLRAPTTTYFPFEYKTNIFLFIEILNICLFSSQKQFKPQLIVYYICTTVCVYVCSCGVFSSRVSTPPYTLPEKIYACIITGFREKIKNTIPFLAKKAISNSFYAHTLYIYIYTCRISLSAVPPFFVVCALC